MRVELTCSSCGQNRFAFPNGGGDEAMVCFADCGHEVDSLGALKDRVERAVLSTKVSATTAKSSSSTNKGSSGGRLRRSLVRPMTLDPDDPTRQDECAERLLALAAKLRTKEDAAQNESRRDDS